MKSLAPIIAVVVLLVVAAFIFISGDDTAPKAPPVANSVMDSPVTAPAGVTSDMISKTPQTITPLLDSVTTTDATKDKAGAGQVAPMLADLVGRLEAKVKTDPANIGNQILLAQTYSELGRTEEGVAILRKVAQTKVETPRVNVVLASLLSKSDKPEDWSAALKLLDDATKADAGQAGIAELYRGRVYIAQGKKDVAIKTWKAALKRIPAADNARAQLEQELAKTN